MTEEVVEETCYECGTIVISNKSEKKVDVLLRLCDDTIGGYYCKKCLCKVFKGYWLSWDINVEIFTPVTKSGTTYHSTQYMFKIESNKRDCLCHRKPFNHEHDYIKAILPHLCTDDLEIVLKELLTFKQKLILVNIRFAKAFENTELKAITFINEEIARRNAIME